MNTYRDGIEGFVCYMMSFYGKNGLYDTMLLKKCKYDKMLLRKCDNMDNVIRSKCYTSAIIWSMCNVVMADGWNVFGGGDSFDREMCRDIVLYMDGMRMADCEYIGFMLQVNKQIRLRNKDKIEKIVRNYMLLAGGN